MSSFYNMWNYDYIQQQAQPTILIRSKKCKMRQNH